MFILLCYCFFVAYQLNEISAQYELCIQNNQQILNLSKEVLKGEEFLIQQVETISETKNNIKPSLDQLLENQELEEKMELKLSRPGDQAKNPWFWVYFATFSGYMFYHGWSVITDQNQN